jgi:para-nitrobenzyl esterase
MLPSNAQHMAYLQGDAPQVKIDDGLLQGTTDAATGIRIFRGIPFAQPPVGELRWREPKPEKPWSGVRKADHFGNKPMQKPIFGDMGFRADSMSEDCLYLNVWTPAKSAAERLPVLVYFYGGGFMAGDGSEPRYDGEAMAKQGIVALTVNYRLGIFGFFAHPELTKESPHQASGNYGLLDQHAALLWVKKNIAAFGGDPDRITIAGESAGSISVSAQMASPLSKNLIAGAIGESGAMINPTLPPVSLKQAEQSGAAFGKSNNANTLAELRAIPAAQLLDDSFKPGAPASVATIDGYFLPKSPVEIFTAGEQARVPLLAGWNSAEVPYQFIMHGDAPTVENYKKVINQLYGDQAETVLKLYPANTGEEVIRSATALSSDRFIVFSTWEWVKQQAQTGGAPVYQYLFSRIRPAMTARMGNATAGLAGGVVKGSPAAPVKMPVAIGASHASEIEYAMGNLARNQVYAWTPEDYKVSATMFGYFVNFVKRGNPNGAGLPEWPVMAKGSKQAFININVNTQAETQDNRDRYIFLENQYLK